MRFFFPDALSELVAILFAAVIVGYAAVRLRQPLVIAFIGVGIIIGPSGANLIRSVEYIHTFAQMGLALLLFAVGLKLDLHLVRMMGPVAIVAGLAQMAVTAIGGYFICAALGLGSAASLFIGASLAFSSTIVVVKLLSDKQETESLHGRIALGILIVQDIAAIVAMIFLSAFAGQGSGAGAGYQLAYVIAKGVTLLVGVGFVGLLVIPRLHQNVVRSTEMLSLFAIAWAMLLSILANRLGFSSEVGAFLAGISLASSEFRDLLGAKLVTLRDFLLLFFFVELGSRLDLSLVGSQVYYSIPIALFVLIGKPAISLGIMGVLGYRKRTSFLTGLSLGQISEFSLILVTMGEMFGHTGKESVGLITMVGLISFGISAFLISRSNYVYEKVSPYLGVFERKGLSHKNAELLNTKWQKPFDVILFGIGRYGRLIAKELTDRNWSVLGVDFDPQAVKNISAEKIPAVFGDPEDPEYLSSLPLETARWAVCSIRDTNVSRMLVTGLRHREFKGIIALTADNPVMVEELKKLDADLIFSPFEDSAVEAVDLIGEKEREIKRKMMNQKIAELKDHYIICGYGRMGQQIVKDLSAENVPLVVIESNPEQLPKLERQNILHVEGDPSEDEVLLQAGIERAKGLISVYPTDEDNVFIVLSARVLNPNLFIVARSVQLENEDKLRRAGADQVMSAYILAGRQMAAMVTKPEIIEFADLVLHTSHFDTNLAYIVIPESSEKLCRSLGDINLWQKCGAHIAAVRRDGELHSNPGPDFTLCVGDEIIILGTMAQIDAAKKILEA